MVARAKSETARITLGHLIMKDLIGDVGAACMSVLAIVAFMLLWVFLAPLLGLTPPPTASPPPPSPGQP